MKTPEQFTKEWDDHIEPFLEGAKKNQRTPFDIWWDNEGSAMRPKEEEDKGEHTKRVALIAWRNGMYEAEMQLDEDLG